MKKAILMQFKTSPNKIRIMRINLFKKNNWLAMQKLSSKIRKLIMKILKSMLLKIKIWSRMMSKPKRNPVSQQKLKLRSHKKQKR